LDSPEANSHELRLLKLAHPLPGSTPAENRRPLRIPGRFDGWLLEQVLRDLFPQVPASEWVDLVKEGRLLAPGGKPAQLQRTVRGGEEFTRVTPDEIEPDVSADIRLLYQDEALIVIHKPAPLPVHPCGRFNRNTLSHMLNLVWQQESPRQCHRLDSNTTGVLVCARSPHFARLVQKQFTEGKVSKRYLTKVWGHVAHDELEINLPIQGRTGKLGLRTVAAENQGLPSLTRLRVLSRNKDGTSTLDVIPVTGRTNQIRVHLWYIGHPVVGDPAYLRCGATGERQTLEPGEEPMHLHCREVGLSHPVSAKHVCFSCEPAWF
jgi:UPF0176 protein